MKKKPLYIILGVVVLISIISLSYISYHVGDGRKTDLPKDSTVLKKEVVQPLKKDTVYVNPEVSMPVYHWKPEVADFTLAAAERLTQSIYDTVTVEKQGDMEGDTVGREFSDVVFFSADEVLHALVVVENRGPFYGVSVGWCDVFAFVKGKDGWKLSDFMLNAGGGGMYGNPGEFQRLELIGNQTVGVILRGGQEHMGGNYHENVIGLNQGKLRRITTIDTHHDYGSGAGDEFKTTVCDENEFKFIPNGRAMYDLKIIRLNCLEDKNKKVKEIVIPYLNGYKIPDAFLFEG